MNILEIIVITLIVTPFAFIVMFLYGLCFTHPAEQEVEET